MYRERLVSEAEALLKIDSELKNLKVVLQTVKAKTYLSKNDEDMRNLAEEITKAKRAIESQNSRAVRALRGRRTSSSSPLSPSSSKEPDSSDDDEEMKTLCADVVSKMFV